MKNVDIKKIGIGIGLILIYLLVIPNIALIIFELLKLNIKNDSIYILLNITIYVLTMIMIVFIYKKDLKKEALIMKKNIKQNLKIGFKYWILAFIFMIISNMIIIGINGGIATNEEQNRSLINTFPIFSSIFMIIVGPFIEEILFRKGFKDAFKNPITYALFSGLLFGSAHLISSFTSQTNPNLTQLLFIIPYSGIGYFFARAYSKTNTIYTSTLFHIIHNAIAVGLSILGG